ncbi:glycosyltransferase [Xanthobacter versatilis]|uniref:glycosyltransferase n=1 Tax=Xanthobacter autotrophicus (strain ATCC BAA-1158 / Py2) TaxID=78245 RepID=UPI0037298CBA
MRIAILSSGYLPVLDGVTVSVDARVQRLAARGHDVLLLAPRPADDLRRPAGLPDGVVFVGLPATPFGAAAGDINPGPAAHAVIEQALAAFRPNLIHVDEPERLAWGIRRLPGLGFARRHGIPAVAFFHTNFVDYWGQGSRLAPLLDSFKAVGWRLVTALYNRFDATLVPSAQTHRRLTGFGLRNGVCGRFNGADTARFSPALCAPGYWGRNWDLPGLDDRPVMLIAGRLTPDKGWSSWDKALPKLARRLGDNLGVVIAGDGALRPRVERLAATLPQAHVLGAVPHADLGALLANSDAYATFSRCENASLAICEALAGGVPVIAPRAGGIPGQVRHGENGLLFAPGDVGDFVNQMARLVEDKALAARLRGTLAAEREMLDWEPAFEAWLDAVSRIADAAGRGRRPPA